MAANRTGTPPGTSRSPQSSQRGSETTPRQVCIWVACCQRVGGAHQPVRQHVKLHAGHLDPEMPFPRRGSSSDYRDGLKRRAKAIGDGGRGETSPSRSGGRTSSLRKSAPRVACSALRLAPLGSADEPPYYAPRSIAQSGARDDLHAESHARVAAGPRRCRARRRSL